MAIIVGVEIMGSPEKATILKYRIPARMAELYAFIEMVPKLRALPETAPIQVVLGSKTLQLSNPTLLWFPIADAAALMSRALLHFLGIGMQNNVLAPPAKFFSTDIRMKDVDLNDVLVDDAINRWKMTPDEAKELLELCVRTGHKVSAHLTELTAEGGKGIDATIPKLAKAFELVINLVNREVYTALGEPEIVFSSTSGHGHIV
jgi:hypothetical protein